MKKFFALIVSAVLLISVFAFAGCNGEGTVKGRYREVPAEEIQTALQDVDGEKLFEGLKGLELSSRFGVDVSGGGEKVSVDIDLGYKLNFEELLGSGAFSVKYENGAVKEDFGVTAYMNSEYAYAELGGNIIGNDMKVKVGFGELLGGLDDTIPYSLTESEPEDEFNVFLYQFQKYHLKTGIDKSRGLKIKVSATEATIWDLFLSEFIIYKEHVKIKSGVFDIYLAIDEDGAFSQFSVKIDVNAKIKIPVTQKDTVKLKYKVSGYFSLKPFNGAVTIPEGIEEDGSYVDMTEYVEKNLEEILEQLSGQLGNIF